MGWFSKFQSLGIYFIDAYMQEQFKVQMLKYLHNIILMMDIIN